MSGNHFISLHKTSRGIVSYDIGLRHTALQRLLNRKNRQLRALLSLHMSAEPEASTDLRSTIFDELVSINRQIRLMLEAHSDENFLLKPGTSPQGEDPTTVGSTPPGVSRTSEDRSSIQSVLLAAKPARGVRLPTKVTPTHKGQGKARAAGAPQPVLDQCHTWS